MTWHGTLALALTLALLFATSAEAQRVKKVKKRVVSMITSRWTANRTTFVRRSQEGPGNIRASRRSATGSKPGGPVSHLGRSRNGSTSRGRVVTTGSVAGPVSAVAAGTPKGLPSATRQGGAPAHGKAQRSTPARPTAATKTLRRIRAQGRRAAGRASGRGSAAFVEVEAFEPEAVLAAIQGRLAALGYSEAKVIVRHIGRDRVAATLATGTDRTAASEDHQVPVSDDSSRPPLADPSAITYAFELPVGRGVRRQDALGAFLARDFGPFAGRDAVAVYDPARLVRVPGTEVEYAFRGPAREALLMVVATSERSVRLELGGRLLSRGRYTEAVRELRRAARAGGDAETFEVLGQAELAAGRPARALKSFQRALRLARNEGEPVAEILAGMAAARAAAGGRAAAVR